MKRSKISGKTKVGSGKAGKEARTIGADAEQTHRVLPVRLTMKQDHDITVAAARGEMKKSAFVRSAALAAARRA